MSSYEKLDSEIIGHPLERGRKVRLKLDVEGQGSGRSLGKEVGGES